MGRLRALLHTRASRPRLRITRLHKQVVAAGVFLTAGGAATQDTIAEPAQKMQLNLAVNLAG
jgi:hypothetical protein